MEFKYLLFYSSKLMIFFLSGFVSHKPQGGVNKEIQLGTSVIHQKSHLQKIYFKSKSRSQLSRQFSGKPFHVPKIIIEVQKFWQGQPIRFCYVGVHHQRRLRFTKQVFLFNVRPWLAQKPKMGYVFSRKMYKKICSVKAKDFWFKNLHFSSSAWCIRVTGLVAFNMAWWLTCKIWSIA